MKNNFSTIASFVIVSGAFVFFYACRKENKTPSWDVDVLAPLVHSSLSINNIIPDSLLQTNPDNSLDIVFNKSLFSFSTITIPDTNLKTSYSLPFSVTVGPGDPVIPGTLQESKINVGPVQLSTARVLSGFFRVSIENHTPKTLDVTYEVPSATLPSTGVFKHTIVVPRQNGSTPGTASVDYDMSGYTLDFTGINGMNANRILTMISAIVDSNDAGLATITPADLLVVTNSIVGLTPEYAKGYFVQDDTSLIDTSSLSMFNHITGGTLDLENIDIGYQVSNGLGADIRFQINELASVNTRSNTTVPLTHSMIGSPVNLNRAIDNNGNVIPSSYSVSINSSNSNIEQFVENLPNHLSYKMDMEINPLGNVSGGNDFYYHKAPMKVDMNIAMPLSLIANDLTMADTVDFGMDENTANVNYGELHLFANNGFPFTAGVQLYVMDDNFDIVDSLIHAPNVIQAPMLDGNLICVGQQMTKLVIPVDADKLELLRSTKKICVKIKFNTTGNPKHVKIYSYYKMDVKLVGDFNYTTGK